MKKGRNHVLTNIKETYNVQKAKHSNSQRQGIQLLETQKKDPIQTYLLERRIEQQIRNATLCFFSFFSQNIWKKVEIMS